MYIIGFNIIVFNYISNIDTYILDTKQLTNF